jgi:hypothetical protein
LNGRRCSEWHGLEEHSWNRRGGRSVGGRSGHPQHHQSADNTNACVANLNQVQGAIEMYALENKLEPTNRVAITDLSGGAEKYIRPLINTGLTCPAGGIYSVTTVGDPPKCSVPGHTL